MPLVIPSSASQMGRKIVTVNLLKFKEVIVSLSVPLYKHCASYCICTNHL